MTLIFFKFWWDVTLILIAKPSLIGMIAMDYGHPFTLIKRYPIVFIHIEYNELNYVANGEN